MGTAKIQGELWGAAPQEWAEIQEPLHTPLYAAMLNATSVRQGTRLLDVGCGGGAASLLAAERGAHVSGFACRSAHSATLILTHAGAL